MESLLENKKTLVIIIILALIAVIFLIFRLFYVPPSSTPKFYSKAGPNADVVPTIAPDEFGHGGGLDTNSPIVKQSQQNIEIIKDKLPYKDVFKSSSGLDVAVYIAGADRQVVPWELEVSVDGMKFLREPNDPEYNNDKTAFLEAADRLFNWVKSNGADPSKIYFGWSNKKYIRDQIQEWLNSR